MRKIVFNKDTITKIEEYIKEGHTKNQTCSRFNIKGDTLNRVMRENNIHPFYKSKSNPIKYTKEQERLAIKLFKNTNTRLNDIRKECHLEYWELEDILKNNFTQKVIDERKAKLYSKSKLNVKNPMYGKTNENHPNYKGIIDDGKGYSMILKPNWYTGRQGSNHVFLHHIIMCEALGITQIPQGFTVHHIDGDKKNNSINNLALLTNAAHSKLHSIQRNLSKV